MKKIYSVFILFLFISSCNTDINIISDEENIYVVHSILNADTSYQVVYLSMSFKNDNEKISIVNKLKDATVRIFNSKEEYILKYSYNSEIEKNNNVQFSSNSFKPISQKEYNLEVIFKDSTKLLSTTQIPPILYETFIKHYSNTLPSKDYIRKIYMNNFHKYLWMPSLSFSNEKTIYYPRMFLHYEYKANYKYEKRILEIPTDYEEKNNKLYSNFNVPSTYSGAVFYDRAIDKTFQLLLKKDKSKENFRIIGLELQVISCDENLGKFLILNRQNSDGFSIILDNYDFTNIENGLGIFGAYRKFSSSKSHSKYRLFIDSEYLSKLGF